VALQMFVRPSAVQIVQPAEAHVMARVRDVAFAGRGYEHALEADGQLFFTRVFSPERWPRGSTVGVQLAPDGCLVLPVDPALEGVIQGDETGRAGEGLVPDGTDLVDLTGLGNK
jgi:hypothetical protein